QQRQPLAVHEHDAIHELHTVLPAGVEHGTDIGAAEAARFLAQNVLARPGCLEDPLLADAGGQRDVHRIHIPPVEQFLVTSARDGLRSQRYVSLAFGDEAASTLAFAAGHGNQRGIARIADRLPVLAGDAGRPKDSPAAEWFGHLVDLW